MPDVATIPWDSAAEAILSRARTFLASRPVVLIGVTGPVGSGKSTLAAKLSACVIGTDSYLPDYDLVPYHERDDPKHSDLARLAADLALLRTGRPARVPVWSFQSHKREGEREIRPAPVVVCEGIHAMHDSPRAQLDITVFIEAPPADRWERWANIERSGQRGWGVETAREYFDRVAEPAFLVRADEYRRAAHFVVENPG